MKTVFSSISACVSALRSRMEAQSEEKSKWLIKNIVRRVLDILIIRTNLAFSYLEIY